MKHLADRLCQYTCFQAISVRILFLMFRFVRDSKFFSALGTTGCQYLLTVGCRHSFHKTMLVGSLSS